MNSKFLNTKESNRMGDRKDRVAKEYFSVAELTEYCGISERTLRTLLNDPVNPIPHFRIGAAGRIIRIKRAEFDAWVDSQRAVQGNEIDELVENLLKGGK
jgi:excisionase family DNA binding protein